MRLWHQGENQRSRRLRAALGLSLAFHASLALLPFSPFSDPGGLAPGISPGSAGRTSRFLAGALQGTDLQVAVPPPPSAPVTPPPEPEPQQEPVPEPETDPPAEQEPHPVGPATSQSGSSDGSATEASGPAGPPGGSGLGEGEGAPTPPAEVAMRPRIYVHPRIPEAVRKRKIVDYVTLQVLVGPTGEVRDVRVLRRISNCPECTESAVESARRFVYEPYVLQGQAVEVWTVPFSLDFSYRR